MEKLMELHKKKVSEELSYEEKQHVKLSMSVCKIHSAIKQHYLKKVDKFITFGIFICLGISFLPINIHGQLFFIIASLILMMISIVLFLLLCIEKKSFKVLEFNIFDISQNNDKKTKK